MVSLRRYCCHRLVDETGVEDLALELRHRVRQLREEHVVEREVHRVLRPRDREVGRVLASHLRVASLIGHERVDVPVLVEDLSYLERAGSDLSR